MVSITLLVSALTAFASSASAATWYPKLTSANGTTVEVGKPFTVTWDNSRASIPSGATVKDKYQLGHGQLSADARAVWFTYPLAGKGAGNTCPDLQPIDVFAQNSVEVVVSRWNGPGVPTTDVIAWAGEPYGSEAAIGKWLVVKPKGPTVAPCTGATRV